MAQLLPLLTAAVNPDAEAHEDDPAGPADARDERRLLDHVSDLLGQTRVVFPLASAASASVAQRGRLFGWRLCDARRKGGEMEEK